MSVIKYPMKLTAPLKDYLWGGKKLKTDFFKETELETVAESWELSCHKDGSSIIANGEYSGMSLPQYIEMAGKEILGENSASFEYFPILIKLIDACDNLSVQVHPNNDYALRVEGEYGKTEMWYIVDCEEGAELLYGFKHTIEKAEFAERIKNNTLLEATNSVKVKKGDVFFIEAGTLHAIGAGILIAEIQQNSNTTYRIYDYGRVDKDGNTRELHIEKALDVTSLTTPTRGCTPQGVPQKAGNGAIVTLLSSCEYFTTEHVSLDGDIDLAADDTSFVSLLCLSGEAMLEAKDEKMTFAKGESIFLPSGFGEFKLTGKCELIKTNL